MRPWLATVTVIVPSYEAGIAAYVGQMGFTLVADLDEGRKRWVVVAPCEDRGARLLLARADTAPQQRAIGAQTAGRVGFFLETEDFAADHARLVAAGIRFLEAPRDEPYGRVAVFEDPFGNRWDLIQPVAGTDTL